eukprot:TRINITY_DN100845_c0_g1_i1.p1 TRINITY_DN100845_c0_g1~~TRINITY_DN100845_c0_g1_i1.p1  ORF type:complete len:690 (+),score=286.91 TRINITY_DN100845_c0_g1_i1:109-2178(+)
MLRHVPFAVFVAAVVVAVRVDDDEIAGQSTVVTIGDGAGHELNVELSARRELAGEAAGAPGAPAASLLDVALQRKTSAAGHAAELKIERAHRAIEAAKIEKEDYDEADRKAKHDVDVLKTAIGSEQDAKSKAEEAISELTAAEEAAVKRIKVADDPGSRHAAQEDLARAAAGLRKARSQKATAEEFLDRSEEEMTQKTDESKAVEAAAAKKAEEIASQQKAEEAASKRVSVEGEALKAKNEDITAQDKLSCAKAGEAAALAAHKKEETAIAAGKRKLMADKAAVTEAKRKKLETEAAALESQRYKHEEEAEKLSEEAVAAVQRIKKVRAEVTQGKAQDRVNTSRTIAQAERKNAQIAAARFQKAEASAAAAEANRRASRAGAAANTFMKAAEEVKAREALEKAYRAKKKAERLVAQQVSEKLKARTSGESADEYKKRLDAIRVADEAVGKADTKYRVEISRANEEGDGTRRAVVGERNAPCADEHGICMCKGHVIYGQKFVNGASGEIRTLQETLASRIRTKPSSWGVLCSNIVFGDPVPGRPKHCFCRELIEFIKVYEEAVKAEKTAMDSLNRISRVGSKFWEDSMSLQNLVEKGQREGEVAIAHTLANTYKIEKFADTLHNEAQRVAIEHGYGEDASFPVRDEDKDKHEREAMFPATASTKADAGKEEGEEKKAEEKEGEEASKKEE